GVPVGTPIKEDKPPAQPDRARHRTRGGARFAKENGDAVQPFLDAIDRAHESFLKNYRAIIWSVSKTPAEQIDALDIIWRQGESLRQDHHLPGFEVQENLAPPLPQPNPAALLAWAAQSDSSVKQLLVNKREYTWNSAAVEKTLKPKVRVHHHGKTPLLDTNVWP